MQNDYHEQYAALNKLEKKADELYHHIAWQLGLSDSAFWTLYCLCESGETYTQNSLAEYLCLPKQTVNSAVNSLVKAGYVYLEQLAMARNNKAVRLTQAGQEFCQRSIRPVLAVEERAFLRMSAAEREAYLELSRQQAVYLLAELSAYLTAQNRSPLTAALEDSHD